MSLIAKQSTAIIVTVGPALDADGVAVTDVAVGDLKISKNGGAPAALNASATLTHRNTGHYSLSLTTSDVDTVGTVEIVIDDTTNAMPIKTLQVIEGAVYDALFAASATGKLPATLATADVTGNLPANVLQWKSSTPADLADTDKVQVSVQHENISLITKIDAIDDLIDTEVAAILAAVDTEVAAILADTNELQTDWTNGGRLDLLIDAILADTNELQGDWANGGRLDLILDAKASQSSVDTIDDFLDTEIAAILAAVDTEVAAILDDTDDIGAAGAGLTAIPWNASWDAEVQSEVDDALKAALTEGYRSTGATGSVRDLLYEIIAHLGESSISGTTKTLKKLDGSTSAKTYTLDSSTTPTSITETT
jgi:hypothetical protein